MAKLNDDSASNVKTIFSNGDAAGWGYGVSGSQGLRSRRLIFAGASDVTSATANATTNVEVISASYTGGAGGSLQLFTNGVGAAGAGAAGTAETLSASTITAQTPTTAFYIGNKSSAAPWTGQVAEIIIFNRSLSTKERNQIELYLGQKYNIKTAATGNIDGCAVSVLGVTQTNVAEGSGSLTCAGNYTGTVPYTCSGGNLTTTTSCTAFQCSITSQNGITSGTNVTPGSTYLACNANNYNTSGGITYTCSGGVASVSSNTCVCNTGFSGPSCSAITCTITGDSTNHLNSKTVSYAASATSVPATACVTGYSGSPKYTCTTSGAEATITSGSCRGWIFMTSSARKWGCEVYDGTTSSTATCDDAYVGKYAVAVSGGTASVSGKTLSNAGSMIFKWFSEYCTSSGCTLDCVYINGGGSSTNNAKVYKCD